MHEKTDEKMTHCAADGEPYPYPTIRGITATLEGVEG